MIRSQKKEARRSGLGAPFKAAERGEILREFPRGFVLMAKGESIRYEIGRSL